MRSTGVQAGFSWGTRGHGLLATGKRNVDQAMPVTVQKVEWPTAKLPLLVDDAIFTKYTFKEFVTHMSSLDLHWLTTGDVTLDLLVEDAWRECRV